ncbi:hypothetical protein DPMN_081956 [Dreissena polymorpha]|uniref:Uncharacterized protein n=1 Tax=Dreissena polymorpha TaxID=45954 RepID=A0A9D3Y8B1_DREPO|nr:hypothetical protein DPMN_081956 [Dreissena polymorpha]
MWRSRLKSQTQTPGIQGAKTHKRKRMAGTCEHEREALRAGGGSTEDHLFRP